MDLLNAQYAHSDDDDGGVGSARNSPPALALSLGRGSSAVPGVTKAGSAGVAAAASPESEQEEQEEKEREQEQDEQRDGDLGEKRKEDLDENRDGELDDDDDDNFRLLAPKTPLAPPVSDALLASKPADVMSAPIDPGQRELTFNVKYDQLWAPLEGPAHPHTRDGRALGLRNHRLGTVQDAAVDGFVFDEQYNTFQAYGYGVDPASMGGQGVVGDLQTVHQNDGATVYNLGQQEQKKRKRERREKLLLALAEHKGKQAEGGEESELTGEGVSDKEKTREEEEEGGEEDERRQDEADESEEEEEERRKLEGGAGGSEEDVATHNPTTNAWLLRSTKSPWSGRLPEAEQELTEEQLKYREEHEQKKARRERGDKGEQMEEKSTFHGKQQEDYQGRSWIAPPKDARAQNEHCYIPKRCIHTWSGHTKGVSKIQFFPKTGHLLLSGSMDTKIKIWDVQGSKKCMRTYMGHSKAVKDVSFSNDGTRFLSSSYDRKIKLWDTETGQVLGSFGTGKIPYVVRMHPDEDKQHILMAGMSDKKIVQWDMKSGEMTQQYDEHLGAVNTITFFDNNRRFVTSSDDKSLLVWEFGIPVVIKHVSEPHMHSMPAITMHPNHHCLAAQSLDNQILIYGTKDRFRLNRKKRFAGHVIAGYACQIGFSPDGRFVMSGDGEGRLWFWDWKSCKVFRTLKCHDQVCIGCEWHPLEQSKVATCSWDGLIKYWD